MIEQFELEDGKEHVILTGSGIDVRLAYWVTNKGNIYRAVGRCQPGNCCNTENNRNCCEEYGCPFPHDGKKECPSFGTSWKLENGEFVFTKKALWRHTWIPLAYLLYPLPETTDLFIPGCKVKYEKVK